MGREPVLRVGRCLLYRVWVEKEKPPNGGFEKSKLRFTQKDIWQVEGLFAVRYSQDPSKQ